MQKFHSTSCRVRRLQVYKGHKASQSKTQGQPIQESKAKEGERISAAGIGNGVIGTTAADLIKSLLTRKENKPAKKADLKRLEFKLQPYHLIKNLKPNNYRKYPYFDLELGQRFLDISFSLQQLITLCVQDLK